jgi:hypothetical protein
MSMNTKSWARNTVTGKVVQVPSHYLTHPVFGKTFVPAQKGDKDYVPELYKAKSSDQFVSKRSRKKDEEAPEVPVIEIEPFTAPDAEVGE